MGCVAVPVKVGEGSKVTIPVVGSIQYEPSAVTKGDACVGTNAQFVDAYGALALSGLIFIELTSNGSPGSPGVSPSSGVML